MDNLLLNQAARARFGVPGGGQYFWNKIPMLDAYKENDYNGFTVAADKSVLNGKKCYGLYTSVTEFFMHLMASSTRCLYELIPSDTKCRGYADVEWKEPKGPAWHHNMDMVLDHLRIKAMRMYGVDADFKVMVSSREDDGLWKYSYHIIIANLGFNNNHDGTMRGFFEITDDMSEDWFWYKKGVRTPIIDQGVYDDGRVFRLPYCSKKASKVPMMPLKAPFHEMQIDDNQDPAHLAEFTVTTMSQPYTLVDSIDVQPKTKKARSASSGSRQVHKRNVGVDPAIASTGTEVAASRTAPGEPLPFPLVYIQELLRMSGELPIHLLGFHSSDLPHAQAMTSPAQPRPSTSPWSGRFNVTSPRRLVIALSALELRMTATIAFCSSVDGRHPTGWRTTAPLLLVLEVPSLSLDTSPMALIICGTPNGQCKLHLCQTYQRMSIVCLQQVRVQMICPKLILKTLS